MESCPVCGDERRNSARFCTTCGHRFADDDVASLPIPAESLDVEHASRDDAEPVISGWPTHSIQDSASPWAQVAANTGGWPAPLPEPAGNSDLTEVTWAEVAATALAPPARLAPPAVVPASVEIVDELEVIDDADIAGTPPRHDDDELRRRARSLMSELRDVIEDLTGESPRAWDEFASELQIALTRPTALDGEAIADLRSAAESAQARPRDLDTLTALTAQAETILALIVGYERATAGIERAIETIRSTSDGAPD